MGGKPVKLWGALHFLEPESFTSMWRWAHQWLEIEEVETERAGMVKKIHGIRKDREEEFNKHIAPHLVRRTKAEVKKDLPPKDRHYIPCEMTKSQKKQYDAMAADAEVKIEDEHLTAVGILAEYTRLKQFADARHKVRNFGNGRMEVKPTNESGKLPQVLRLLEERGITVNPEDAWGEQQVVIGSQFSSVCEMVHEYLNEQGIPAAMLIGKRTVDDAGNRCTREELVNKFQAGEIQVVVISTKAGGVSITLDRADTVIIMDETWNPDDQGQLEDRVHRISRIHQVTIFYLYSKGTIEEYIQSVVWDKADINRSILDLRRKAYRAVQNQKVAA
jgi:SNF2 family DNA or RNA helicase